MKDGYTVDKYTAVLNGERTGLAGCSNADCSRACVRRDIKLVSRVLMSDTPDSCTKFIHVQLLSY